ncbi:hypothetical protein ACFSTA_12205 [Ornithinibacillus salinisoli]|uniref:Endolytic transglycosylase MltG n=1 Tax=Ornithinibacillus salinisoli TaxID=1848459 RepID=A0ABW4W2Q6_9BACI
MKHSIRAFAIGLFSAGLITLIVNYFDNGSKQDLSEVAVDDLISELENEGYRVLDESEFITLTVNDDSDETEAEAESTTKEDNESEESDQADEQEESESNSNENVEEAEEVDDESEQQSVQSYTLTIESGMPTSTISHELEENGIIENADELIQYMDSEGYSLRVQLGEFTITSDMSHYEIAEAITR